MKGNIIKIWSENNSNSNAQNSPGWKPSAALKTTKIIGTIDTTTPRKTTWTITRLKDNKTIRYSKVTQVIPRNHRLRRENKKEYSNHRNSRKANPSKYKGISNTTVKISKSHNHWKSFNPSATGKRENRCNTGNDQNYENQNIHQNHQNNLPEYNMRKLGTHPRPSNV